MQRLGWELDDLTKVSPAVMERLRFWAESVISGQVVKSDTPLCGKGLILVGGAGSGKSAIGLALLQTILVATPLESFVPDVKGQVLRPGYFLPFSDLVDLKSEIIRGDGDAEFLQQIHGIHAQDSLNVRVLVLDDLGKEHMTGSGWTKTLLAETIRRRFDAGFTTIVTTNVAANIWADVYGESVGGLAMGAFFPAIPLDVQVEKNGKR